MPTNDRVNQVLDPFLRLPIEQSQILITNVLGASSTWLTLQYLGALLEARDATSAYTKSASGDAATEVSVILVSWLRDWAFWRKECRRSTSLDLQQAYTNGRFVFVDGLSQMFLPTSNGNIGRASAIHPSVLYKPDVDSLLTLLERLIADLKKTSSRSVVLILDAPTLLLQTTRPPISALELNAALMKLRGQVGSVIVTVQADDALLAPAVALDIQDPGKDYPSTTPLEADNAAFVIGAAHQASSIFQCRRLDTGWADDVSGVLRVTKGAAFVDANNHGMEEGEWLYHVANDGTLNVWSRT